MSPELALPHRKSFETLAERAYAEIEAMFVNGTLRPGSFVSEPQLQLRLGLGRTPVREAIKRFEADRLLLPLHRKGIYIPPIDLDDHLHLLEVRRPVELLSFALAAERADEDERSQMNRCLQDLDKAEAAADMEATARVDYRSKMLAISATRNPHVAVVLRPIHTLSRRFWNFHVNYQTELEWQLRSNNLWRQLLATVMAGAVRDAEAATRAYMDFLNALIHEILAPENGAWRQRARP